ncbi:enoyl-CoA hydratase-related protein [Nesterenkonia ebinurensis]|uniref:enoyl-CoA hydratase-related protein n=1 Tax=Nesterenkonia ebinurensis TaxID=2608252 RepID=UPI00123E2448
MGNRPLRPSINGWCIGGGIQLALACDIRLGTTQSRFGITPARLGIVISHQTTTRMEAELGPA